MATLAELSEQYLRHLTVTHYAPGTVDNRRRYQRTFLQWCQERDLLEPGQITRTIMESYQRHLYRFRKPNGSGYSVRAQHAQLVCLRGFFRYLAKRRHIDCNPAADLDMPKLPDQLPRALLSISEAEQVLSVPDLTTPVGLRNRAILETLYSSGIRRSELLRLSLYDIDDDHGTLFVRHGKTKKDRIVPIGDRALRYIIRYRYEARPIFAYRGEETDILFLTTEGRPLVPRRLSHIVKTCLLDAGIDRPGCCHIFRHTMATLLLENGCDVRHIQEMLGHAKLETTQIYTRVSITEFKKAHARAHPAHDTAEDARQSRQPELNLFA